MNPRDVRRLVDDGKLPRESLDWHSAPLVMACCICGEVHPVPMMFKAVSALVCAYCWEPEQQGTDLKEPDKT